MSQDLTKQSLREHPKNETKKESPLWLAILLFILSFLYLFPEVVFNAALTDVAGGRSSTEDELRAVELFGRSISGIGVSLLFADLLLKGRLVTSVFRTFCSFVLILVIVWPFVFFGQKWLVDHLIVDASNGSERQHAFLAQIVRSALIENSIEIPGIEYDPHKTHTSTEKTFLSIFGGLVYADEKLIGIIENRKEEIMGKYIHDYAMKRFDDNYAQYEEFRETIRAKYKEYAKGSNKYNKGIQESPERADIYWLEMQNKIKTGWSDYQSAEKAYEARVEVRAQGIAPRVKRYFDDRKECAKKKKTSSENSCYKNLREKYDSDLKIYKIKPIPPKDWLIREEVSSLNNLATSIWVGATTGGLYTILQGIDLLAGGDGNMSDHRYIYTSDVSHYKKILMVKMEHNFIKDTGGYPFGIDSIRSFRFHDITSEKAKASLSKKGLSLPDSWDIQQRSVFDAAVLGKVQKRYDEEWWKSLKAKGLSIPPNLSWKKFQVHPDVQSKIEAELGEAYVKPMLADWNDKQFKRNVVDVNIKRETKKYLKILESKIAEFEDGGSMEGNGKSALSATIIPPISMSISLLLVLLTVIKLPIKAIGLFKAKFGNKDEDTSKSKPLKIIKKFIPFSLIACIFVVPLTLGGNQYSKEASAVNYFFEQMDENDSAEISFVLKWLLATQPIVQPIGLLMDEKIGIISAFDAISTPINNLDLKVFPPHHESKPSPKKAADNAATLIPLTIKSNIPNAKIYVMNIKPQYKHGMLLPSGRYDIKVSGKGHSAVRKWIYLQGDNNIFSINI